MQGSASLSGRKDFLMTCSLQTSSRAGTRYHPCGHSFFKLRRAGFDSRSLTSLNRRSNCG
jgi:hypothetical protein